MDMTYFPPYSLLKEGLATAADDELVVMSRDMFHMLVAAGAKATAFDPEWYRAAYPDVGDAIDAGAVEDELDHYARSGYEEGRLPAYFEIDEVWYLETYADIAEAVSSGEIISPEAFFNDVGYSEGRTKDAQSDAQAERWRKVIGLSAEIIRSRRNPTPDPSSAAQ